MPIIAPEIVYFDNNQQANYSYIDITADYNSKKINCKLKDQSHNVKIYQKKWVLNTIDKKRVMETYSDSIDFSLAQKFPIITCESILYDGLFFKKDILSENFSVFENWPNISPGIKKYSISSISDFSISNYFKTKEPNQFFFCESGTDTAEEKNFCSLIDRETGSIENKNNDFQKISSLLGNEKYRIFNLTIGLKQENKVQAKVGIQFVLTSTNIENEKLNIPPTIEFKNSIFNKYFICHSNLFLYTPNNKEIIWYKNGKTILNINSQILQQKYIEYGQDYQCSNNNGMSDAFAIDNKYLEINGSSQIGFDKDSISKSIQYETNLNILESKYSWSCQASNNIQCNVSTSDKQSGLNIVIIPNENFKKSLLHEKIKISLTINGENFEKEIVIYNINEKENITENISNTISIKAEKNEQAFYCDIPESIQKSTLINIYWYIDNREISSFRNKNNLIHPSKKNYVTCVVAGKFLNKNIIGAASFVSQDPNKKNPSWLKENYIFNLNDIAKKYLFKENIDVNTSKINCYLSTDESYKLSNNICYIDEKNNVYLKFNDNDVKNIKDYVKESQFIDLYNIPNFPLIIRVFENGKYTNLHSSIKFFVPNEKPKILYAGIIDIDQGQKCFLVVQDPQNSFLSTQFTLDKNRINKNISSFNNKYSIKNTKNRSLINLLERKNIYYFEYNFKFSHKEDYCNVIVTNGTTLSSLKTQKTDEKNLLTILTSIHSKMDKNTLRGFSINEKSLRKFDKELIDNFDKININFQKNNLLSSKSPFLLKFNFLNQETNLNVYYSEVSYLQNLMKFPSPEKKDNFEIENNKMDEKLDFNFSYFLGLRLNKKENNEFKCEVNMLNFEENPLLIKYHLFQNGQILFSKNTYKKSIDFELKNIKNTDTITCQVEIENKVESTSLTEKDGSGVLSYCYALDKNNSILTFECPDILNLKYSDKELKNMLEERLIYKYKKLINIDYAYMSLWTESQKNKYSLITKINEIN